MDQRIIPLIGIAAVMLGSCDSDEPKGNEDNSSKTEAPAGYVPVSVLEYSPAPGQFVNELPLYRDGYGIEDMRKAASEAIDKGDFIIAGIDTTSLLQAVDTAVSLCRDGQHGRPVPDYTDENVSTKVVKIIQSYVGIVNKMVWRKDS